MSDVNFPLTADADFDDLPRTVRREKEARAREAREARERARRDRDERRLEPAFGDLPSCLSRDRPAPPPVYGDEPVAAAVRRFDVPFLHLMAFFLKAVVAAIPALMLLGVILYFAGKGLEAYFPEFVRMKIMIMFPGDGSLPR
jgi:hypothetical protein